MHTISIYSVGYSKPFRIYAAVWRTYVNINVHPSHLKRQKTLALSYRLRRRVMKSLRTKHTFGTPPSTRDLEDVEEECVFLRIT